MHKSEQFPTLSWAEVLTVFMENDSVKCFSPPLQKYPLTRTIITWIQSQPYLPSLTPLQPPACRLGFSQVLKLTAQPFHMLVP